MSAPDFPSQPMSSSKPEDEVRHDASELADTAREDLGNVVDEVKQQAAAIGDEAKAQLADAAEQAKGMAAEQKDLIADQLGGVSSALGKVAGELEGKGEASARYVRMIADGADKLTSTVRSNDVDDILAMAQDFGRRQPVAFMGAAALLGFVASRFVMASASHASGGQQGTSKPPQAPSSYAAGTVDRSNTAPSYGQSSGGRDAGI